MSKVNLTREEYKAIKKYNREEMDKFLENLYRRGFKDGTEVENNVDFRINLSKALN